MFALAATDAANRHSGLDPESSCCTTTPDGEPLDTRFRGYDDFRGRTSPGVRHIGPPKRYA